MTIPLYPHYPRTHALAKLLADAGKVRIVHDRVRNVFVAVAK